MSISEKIADEPVAIQAAIQAGIALGTAFGLGWSPGQVGAVMAFSAAILAFFTRKAVSPVGRTLPPPLPKR